MRTQLLIRLEPETKAKIRKIARAERRDMTSLVLSLLDKKIAEVNNGLAK